MTLKKKIPIFFTGFVLTFFISINGVIAAEMKDGEILQILQKYDEYLTQGNLAWDYLRPIGMWALQGLAKILDGLSGTLMELIKLLNFVDNSEFQALLEKVEPIKWGLLFLFLIGFFVLIMFNKVNDGFQAPLNLLLLICMTFLMPFFFSTTATMVQDIFGDLTSGFDKPGTSIILQNTTDLRAVAEEGWKMKNGETLNHYKEIRQIDMQEKLDDPGDITNGDPLNKKIFTNSKGKDELKDIDKAEGVADFLAKKIFSEKYYRNKVWIFNGSATMIVMIAAMALTAIKFAIIIHKLYGDYALLLTGGLADFMNMQRVKALFSEIAGTFALIVYIPILTMCYTISVSIINSMNFNFFTYLVAMIGAAIALIDGPNGFQRITGIDAGLKSSAAVIATTLGGSRLANKAFDATANIAKSAGGLLSDVGAFGLGAAFGGSGSDGDGQKGINEDEPNTDNPNEEPEKGINEKDPRDSENDNGPNSDEENASSDDDNKNDNDVDSSESDSEQNRETDGPGSINNPENDPENSSLDEMEPPEDGEGNGADGSPAAFNSDEDSSMDRKDGTGGINAEPTQNSTPSGDRQDGISSDDEDPTGINEEPVDTEEPVTEAQQPPAKPSVGPSKVDKELSDLRQSNPLKKEVKQKVFGYDQNDPRRYSKQTTLERKKSSFEAGNEYRKYRQKKKELEMRKKRGD